MRSSLNIFYVILVFALGSCHSVPEMNTPATDAPVGDRDAYISFIEVHGQFTEEDAAARAEKDFMEGKYYVIEYGDFTNPKLAQNLEKIWKAFNVRIVTGTAFSSAGEEYSNRMKEMLRQNGTDVDQLFALCNSDDYKDQLKLGVLIMADSLNKSHTKQSE